MLHENFEIKFWEDFMLSLKVDKKDIPKLMKSYPTRKGKLLYLRKNGYL